MKMSPSVHVLVIVVVLASPVLTQEQEDDDSCFFLCAPEVKIEPTFTFEPIFSLPTVGELDVGTIMTPRRVETETVFELVLAVGIPTEIPRVDFTVETIFIPSGTSETNPFTGVTAVQRGRSSFRGNEIEFELELNLGLVESEQTGGWIESHFDIVDKISAAKRPEDTSSYTHKLNFEWDTSFLVFRRLPDGNWLRNVEVEASLDYVATGLPKAGDVVGGEYFVSDDSPWSFSLVFVFPLAPIVP